MDQLNGILTLAWSISLRARVQNSSLSFKYSLLTGTFLPAPHGWHRFPWLQFHLFVKFLFHRWCLCGVLNEFCSAPYASVDHMTSSNGTGVCCRISDDRQSGWLILLLSAVFACLHFGGLWIAFGLETHQLYLATLCVQTTVHLSAKVQFWAVAGQIWVQAIKIRMQGQGFQVEKKKWCFEKVFFLYQ